MAQCTTLLIDLTLEEHLQIWGEKRGGMCKRGIFHAKPATSLKTKRSRAKVTTERL